MGQRLVSMDFCFDSLAHSQASRALAHRMCVSFNSRLDSNQEERIRRPVAHQPLNHSTPGLRIIKKKGKKPPNRVAGRGQVLLGPVQTRGFFCTRDLSVRVTARAEDAQETPPQSHTSPSMLEYEDYTCYFQKVTCIFVDP